MASVQREYLPPIVSSYGQDTDPEDLANLFSRKKLSKKGGERVSNGSAKLYGYESGGFAISAAVAANVAAVVNAVAYANAAVATLAVAVLAVVTFPGNMQRLDGAQ
jgi:hypothetical protein